MKIKEPSSSIALLLKSSHKQKTNEWDDECSINERIFFSIVITLSRVTIPKVNPSIPNA